MSSRKDDKSVDEVAPEAAAGEPDSTVETEVFRAVDLARNAGMFPEFFPGPRLQPALENHKAWLYRAAKLRGISDEDRITKDEFDKRVAEVSSVVVR
jgi:hypothetical protein